MRVLDKELDKAMERVRVKLGAFDNRASELEAKVRGLLDDQRVHAELLKAVLGRVELLERENATIKERMSVLDVRLDLVRR